MQSASSWKLYDQINEVSFYLEKESLFAVNDDIFIQIFVMVRRMVWFYIHIYTGWVVQALKQIETRCKNLFNDESQDGWSRVSIVHNAIFVGIIKNRFSLYNRHVRMRDVNTNISIYTYIHHTWNNYIFIYIHTFVRSEIEKRWKLRMLFLLIVNNFWFSFFTVYFLYEKPTLL